MFWILKPKKIPEKAEKNQIETNGQVSDILEWKQQINYKILQDIFSTVFFDNIFSRLNFFNKKKISNLREDFLDEKIDENISFNKKDILAKITTFFEKQLFSQVKTQLNNDDLIDIEEKDILNWINNFKDDNSKKTIDFTKNQNKKFEKFERWFLALFNDLKTVSFLFPNFPEEINLEKNNKEQLSGRFMFKIFNLISSEKNPTFLKKEKQFSIYLSLLQEWEKLKNKELAKIISFIHLKKNFEVEKNIIFKIIEENFFINFENNEAKFNKFIKSKVIKELYEIKDFEKRKKITQIVFLKSNLFMWEEKINNQKLFDYLIKNEEKLKLILKFFENNNISKFWEEDLIKMFEKNIFKIEKEKISFDWELRKTELKWEKPKPKAEKNPNPNTKNNITENKEEEINLNHTLDKSLENLLSKNNTKEIEEVWTEIEKFLKKIIINPKEFSSTNDNSWKWWWHFAKKINSVLDKIKKQNNESYSEFLERIKIIDFSSFFENTELSYKKDISIKEALKKTSKKWLFETLNNFWEDVISEIKLNNSENLDWAIKKYDKIIKRELKTLDRKFKSVD